MILPKIVQFSSLALGARFRYATEHASQKTFVKLDALTIAEWDSEQVSTNWVGQGVYSASEDEKDFAVIVVP